MTLSYRWRTQLAALLVAPLLAACGIGGQDTQDPPAAPPSSPPNTTPDQPGAPTLTNNAATDGFNWFNFRRQQIGLSVLARNPLLDTAASGHANYLRQNNTVSHDQVSGKPGFTGAQLPTRLANAGYTLSPTGFAYGEVLSAAGETSGFYHAEELIAAIYHRFVIFQPQFKEMGTGSAVGNNRTYFVTDFAATNGHGTGLGRGNIVVYPAASQTKVPTNFLSDNEAPDPVPAQNEVGYPISVHADITSTLTVQRFSVRPRDGNDLTVRLLTLSTDGNTKKYEAAIVPLTVLRANTVYEVTFSGTLDGAAVNRSWSFTTK